MIVFAGLRGSGKTYQLVHAMLEDPNGVVVVPTHEMVRWMVREYPAIEGRAHAQRDLMQQKIPYGSVLYIDEVKSGAKLGPFAYEVGGMAIQAVSYMSNEHLPKSYVENAHRLYGHIPELNN